MNEETEKPPIVIVTTETGREIRFRADEWDAEEQLDLLTVGDDKDRSYVASFAAGRWTSVRLDGVTTDDADAQRDLLLAKNALEKIWVNINGQHQDFTAVAKIIDEVSDKIGWLE